jgi:type IV pilus assembly protein PilB
MSQRYDMHPALVSRLKVMAGLDIAERRRPQDGRIQVQASGQTIDLRFSSMPSIHGEKVVLRILDRGKAILDINKLGFASEVLTRFKSLLSQPNGLALVCGPTGSGKTTTLYAAITLLNTIEKNIITIEDPVEYQLDGVNQNQVKASIGLDFAKFLKHALRQDPDILLVGEVRDRETAEIAIQASLTGHLVLTTIHTNDAASAITRLVEMGIETFLIASALIASLAQRLVRKICPDCRTAYFPVESVVKELGLEESKQVRLFRGRGCDACYDSGFKSRIGIHELIAMDEKLQGLILDSSDGDALKSHLRKNGHRTMRLDGYQKVIEGVTTIEEVRRTLSL